MVLIGRAWLTWTQTVESVALELRGPRVVPQEGKWVLDRQKHWRALSAPEMEVLPVTCI